MRKALSAPAIVFKGSGWAKKDARSAARSSPSKDDSATGGDKTKSDGGTGTAKEATAPAGD